MMNVVYLPLKVISIATYPIWKPIDFAISSATGPQTDELGRVRNWVDPTMGPGDSLRLLAAVDTIHDLFRHVHGYADQVTT